MQHIIKDRFLKGLKKKKKFAKLVSELGIDKTTIIFRINVL